MTNFELMQRYRQIWLHERAKADLPTLQVEALAAYGRGFFDAVNAPELNPPPDLPPPEIAPHTVCTVCGGRAAACRVLGHRPPGDETKWY